MELKSTINIILKDLEDARDLIDDLRNYPGVPLIQIELARSKCRSAEDVIKLLSSLLEESMAVPDENSAPGGVANLAMQGKPVRNEAPSASYPEGDDNPKPVESERSREAAQSDKVTDTEEDRPAAAIGGESSGMFKTTEVKNSDPERLPQSEDDHSIEASGAEDDHSIEASGAEDDHSIEASGAEDDHSIEASGAEEDHSIEASGAEDDHSIEASEAEDGHSIEATEPEAPHSDKPHRIVADRFTHLSERFNEQIGDSKNSSQDSARVKKKITDITREIGINDRFFLIRELFGGSQEKYVTALTELNRVTSDEEAKQVIEKYSSNSGDREAGKMLSELVKRKLSSTHG